MSIYARKLLLLEIDIQLFKPKNKNSSINMIPLDKHLIKKLNF